MTIFNFVDTGKIHTDDFGSRLVVEVHDCYKHNASVRIKDSSYENALYRFHAKNSNGLGHGVLMVDKCEAN